MRGIRLSVLVASFVVAALLPAPPAWAVTPVTFTGPTDFAVGDSPNSVAVGDFNGDGDPDLVVANEFGESVSVLLGGAGGGFGAATNIATGGFPFAVAVGDFNGDGDPDLAVADAFDGVISVLLGSAGGTFTGPTNFPAGSFPAAVAVGDFNGDGDPDLAVADQADRRDPGAARQRRRRLHRADHRRHGHRSLLGRGGRVQRRRRPRPRGRRPVLRQRAGAARRRGRHLHRAGHGRLRLRPRLGRGRRLQRRRRPRPRRRQPVSGEIMVLLGSTGAPSPARPT